MQNSLPQVTVAYRGLLHIRRMVGKSGIRRRGATPTLSPRGIPGIRNRGRGLAMRKMLPELTGAYRSLPEASGQGLNGTTEYRNTGVTRWVVAMPRGRAVPPRQRFPARLGCYYVQQYVKELSASWLSK